jgi:RND family efflux transporter MFP subunit
VRPAVSGFVEKVCFKAGDEVKKGDVLFELDSRAAQLTVEKAVAELELAEAKKTQADKDIERVRKLFERNVVSTEEVDRVTGQAAPAKAAVKLAKIEVARAKLELAATKVTAPMSGHVGRPLVEPGTLVFRGSDRATLLTTVTVLDPINLTFDMDERTFLDYQRLQREKKAKGAGSSLRLRLGTENDFGHEATLESFDSQLNAATGTMRVHGSIPNPDQRLPPGMFIRVRMTLGPPRAVLVVPEDAVLSDQGKKYVLVVNDRNLAERRAVTLGPTDNGMRIIEKGLRDEDWLIIADFAGIHPGEAVAPKKKTSPKRRDSDRDQNH